MNEVTLEQANDLHDRLTEQRRQLRDLRWLRQHGFVQIEASRPPDRCPPRVRINDADDVNLSQAVEDALLKRIQHLEAQLRDLGVEPDQSEVRPLTR